MKPLPGIVRVIQKIDSFFDMVSKICFALTAIIIIGITVLIFASVINRTFIGSVWLFVEDYATCALIPISYLVFGYVLREDRHLNMDLVFSRCPYKVKIILSLFAGVFTIFVCCFMLSESWSYMIYQLEYNVVSSGAMKITLWPLSCCIFVSLILFLIDLILFVLNRIIQLIYDEQPLKFSGKIYRADDPRAKVTEIDGVELNIPAETDTEGGDQ